MLNIDDDENADWLHGPRQGAVRYKKDGEWVIVNPSDPTYSSALMLAEDIFIETEWETYA